MIKKNNHPIKQRHYRQYLICLLAWALLSCDNNHSSDNISFIDNNSHQSRYYSERIAFIVVHYTAQNNEQSLHSLTQTKVSSHYLILQGNYPIYQLVSNDKAAWHAGVSSFHGRHNLNNSSLGIEIVNEGISPPYQDYKGYHPYRHFSTYKEQQILQVGKLLQQLSQQYAIHPTYIVAHSDITPQRKMDPGAKFPWERLYREFGVGAWYDDDDVQTFINQGFGNVSIGQIKAEFRQYGYTMNHSSDWDKESQNVVYAFQLHFNPKNATGLMDLESWAILQALNKKYRQS